jgi:two-component system OmpR family response regulator
MRNVHEPNGRSSKNQVRVLVVDDEPYITDLVSLSLRYEGFQTREAHTGKEALSAAAEFDPQLVVLDVMLPDLDGLEVTRRLRASGRQMPILFLTARDATEDKVAGLTVGGDDYVTKPFSLEELVARIRAILRRAGAATTGEPLVYADLTLDDDLREVRRGGRVIQLTPTEFNLLRYLMHNPRRVLSKSQIMDHVWDYDFGGDPNVIETYISYLRKKLDRGGPPLIQTVRGVGYCLRLAGD